MFGIVWVYAKAMITPSMIVGHITILLQPHVGRFHASDQEKNRFSANSQASLAIKWGYNSMQVLQYIC